MPLKGRNNQNGEEALIIENFDLLRMWDRSKVLICPFCEEPLVTVREHMREGDWVQAYLRHKGECSTTYAHHPESAEHLAAKAWIKANIPEIYEYKIAAADCEVQMPEINRIADVCFTLANGDRIVHEAQLAAIGVDELEARTNDYQSLGYSIVWHLGKAADTGGNRTWATRRLGGCEIIAFDEQIGSV
jgi:competence CoiA-like predicted nuclease